jgi:prepilin peptidase dependent protein B
MAAVVIHRHRDGAAHGQGGFSLVELLVGLALGLLVVAAATLLLAQQAGEQRRLLMEARLMQDLRTAADLVTRDLRRAGFWGDAGAGVWSAASAPLANPYAALAPQSAASNAASYAYSRDATENHQLDTNEQFGLRLRNGAIELQLGAGNWQALTDATLITITALQITPLTEDAIDLGALCGRPCAGAGATCPPRLFVRSVEVQIGARASSDATVTRSLQTRVRLRNDHLAGACPA